MSGIIGLDINVLVRFLQRDDEAEWQLAERFMATLSPESPGFVSTITLIETTWVLTRVYGMTHAEYVPVLLALLNTRELVFQDFEAVNAAFEAYAQHPKTVFADALITEAARQAGAQDTVTFDKRAAATLGMTLLK